MIKQLDLFIKDETNCRNEADKCCNVVPMQLLALETHHGDNCENRDGDDLLNDLQLHQRERTSVDV